MLSRSNVGKFTLCGKCDVAAVGKYFTGMKSIGCPHHHNLIAYAKPTRAASKISKSLSPLQAVNVYAGMFVWSSGLCTVHAC